MADETQTGREHYSLDTGNELLSVYKALKSQTRSKHALRNTKRHVFKTQMQQWTSCMSGHWRRVSHA